MAITSYGYPGSIDARAWAQHAWMLGSVYAVAEDADWRVSATPSGVTVAPGVAHGQGVTDVSDAPVPVALTPPGSGSRYWLVALRRTWQTTNQTTVVAVDLGSSQPGAVPMGAPRNNEPGVIDDQPLALVSWVSGATSFSVVDLRLVGPGKAQVASSPLVLPLVDHPGHVVRIGPAEHRRGLTDWTGSIAGSVTIEGVLQPWAPSGGFPGQFAAPPSQSWPILAATVPDYGVPYRIRAYAEGEWGAEASSGVRWDFAITVDGLMIGRHVTAADASGVRFRTIVAPRTSRQFTGQREVLAAAIPIYGGGYVGRTAHNSRLVVEVVA